MQPLVVELLVGAALAAGAVSYVLRPIFRPMPPGAAEGGEVAFCVRCGTSLEPGAQFCSRCGARAEG